MKRKFFIVMAGLIIPFGVNYAQGEMDAYKMSSTELTGTARSVAMGGAFGALGGDISGVAINPAGIGIYKSSEIVTTMNFQTIGTKTEANGGKFEKDKFKFSFDNLGVVGVLPTNSDVAPLINVGFSYNKIKSFNRKYKTAGIDVGSSLSDYMAYRAEGYNPSELSMKNNTYAWDNDWLAVGGFNSFLINNIGPNTKGVQQYESAVPNNVDVDNVTDVQEKGSISSYDFNVGTTISDVVSVGLTLAVTDIDYRLSSVYSEDYYNASSNHLGGFDMYNWLKTEGTGWQIKTGVIVKPVDALRIGLAYHSPTWYKMTDYTALDIDHNLKGLGSTINSEYEKGVLKSDGGVWDYNMRTPDKFVFSLAGVINQIAIISADYEYTNYKSNMRLYNRDGDALSDLYNPNTFIKEDFRGASTLRLGAEFRFTPQLSGRLGYAWMQSPLKKDFKDNLGQVMTVGSVAHYTLDGDINNFTWGLGYRFTKNFYLDVAFIYKTQKSDAYAFSYVEKLDIAPEKSKATLKTNTMQGLMTFGVRF